MKERLKRVVHFIAGKPVIGGLMHILIGIVRLPQMRGMVFVVNHQVGEITHQINEMSNQVNEINHQINEMSNQVNEINRQINEMSSQVNEINRQINEIKRHQEVYDTKYLPDLLDSLDYQENLKKSLPVVLRLQVRKLREFEKLVSNE